VARNVKYEDILSGATDLEGPMMIEKVMLTLDVPQFVLVYEALQAQKGKDARIDRLMNGIDFTFVRREELFTYQED
jgi:hypothetical protein